MREPTYPIIVIALAILVAPAFAQREERGLPRLEEQRPVRTPEEQRPPRMPEGQGPPRMQTFGGRAYHGQLPWRDGRWHHAMHDGRDGWWWDVGGFWYFYPVEGQPEGPPDYVSDVEVTEAAASPATPAPAPAEPNYAVYYRPGDLTGTRYQTLEECEQAKAQAENAGVCVLK
jgi:hypothetical protein